MRTDGTGAAPPTLREVRGGLMDADEQKLARIIAMIDALPERGEADLLIEPLRARLDQMALPRPLSFSRLLFIPLDPVLVPGGSWRPGMIGVPRTVIRSLTALVRARLGPAEAERFDAELAGRVRSDRAAVACVGQALWPAAARAAADAAIPPDWTERSGLPPAEFAPLWRIAVAAWEQAVAMQAAARDPGDMQRLARAVLGGAAARAPDSLATVVALAIEQVAAPGELLDALGTHADGAQQPVVQQARAQAFGFMTERLGAPLSERDDMRAAALEVVERADKIAQLAGWAQFNPTRHSEVQEARRRADAACRTRFQGALATLAPPGVLPPEQADRAIDALEGSARDLRRFAQAARLLGSEEFYDSALRAATARLTAPAQAGLDGIDRVRLTEVLMGSKVAAALFEATRAAARRGPRPAPAAGG